MDAMTTPACDDAPKTSATHYTVFISDAELCKRWRCSVMKLWRMRQDGRLRKGIKPGGGGPNLNYMLHIEDIEAASAARGTDETRQA
jgi:hypothetical protein